MDSKSIESISLCQLSSLQHANSECYLQKRVVSTTNSQHNKFSAQRILCITNSLHNNTHSQYDFIDNAVDSHCHQYKTNIFLSDHYNDNFYLNYFDLNKYLNSYDESNFHLILAF